MTKEEAKDFLIDISYKLGNMSVEYLTEKDGERMREAINTLEQESCDDVVLDKIRSEIENRHEWVFFTREFVLQIIDKYDRSKIEEDGGEKEC